MIVVTDILKRVFYSLLFYIVVFFSCRLDSDLEYSKDWHVATYIVCACERECMCVRLHDTCVCVYMVAVGVQPSIFGFNLG